MPPITPTVPLWTYHMIVWTFIIAPLALGAVISLAALIQSFRRDSATTKDMISDPWGDDDVYR